MKTTTQTANMRPILLAGHERALTQIKYACTITTPESQTANMKLGLGLASF